MSAQIQNVTQIWNQGLIEEEEETTHKKTLIVKSFAMMVMVTNNWENVVS